MCTLTYLPQPDEQGYLLTVNRDESIQRPPATAPALYHLAQGKAVVFPRDEAAGGTWIAFNDNRAVCLLNGAFISHNRQSSGYKRSRGLVLLDSFDYIDIKAFVEKYDFNNIEPFTIISITHQLPQNKLCEIRWDGNKVYYKEMEPHVPQIWSSATLYEPETVLLRQKWFETWLEEQKKPFESDSIVHFHRTAGDGNPLRNLIFDKGNGQKTLSITQIVKDAHTTLMQYWSLR